MGQLEEKTMPTLKQVALGICTTNYRLKAIFRYKQLILHTFFREKKIKIFIIGELESWSYHCLVVLWFRVEHIGKLAQQRNYRSLHSEFLKSWIVESLSDFMWVCVSVEVGLSAKVIVNRLSIALLRVDHLITVLA